MPREIAGPRWESLSENDELALFRGILDEGEEIDEDSDRFNLIHSAIPHENTHPPRSGYTNDSRQHISCALPQHVGYPTDPPGIGDWPRRLLHVPTMTSVEYTSDGSGNATYKYKGADGSLQWAYNPRYNAISYTWGRYVIKKPNEQDREGLKRWERLPVLKIKNEGKWDIPRVRSEYIDVKNFERLLSTACRVAHQTPVDFVWLDVACINQQDGNSEKNLEIGRQASIFRNAKAVVIWLHQKSHTHLTRSIQDLMAPGYDTSKLHTTIDWFLSDKWFSSLWTYQEAYLSQDKAWFSSQLGVIYPGMSLAGFVNRCAEIGNYYERHLVSIGYYTLPSRTHEQKLKAEICELLDNQGILALAQRSPFALYSASWGRQTQKEWDRIYGIQQVFLLRVGTSVEGSNPNATYNILTLEAQLGGLLLENFPVNSQLHVFEEPVMRGAGWHISSTSRIPRWDFPRPLQSYDFRRRCTLKAVDSVVDGLETAIGHYNGYLLGLSSLQPLWQNADRMQLAGPPNFRSVHKISLDVVASSMSTPGERPEFRKWGTRRDDPSGNYQHQLLAWLGMQSRTAIISVLLLGDFDVEAVGQDYGGTHYCGMLLQDEGHRKPKKRIGVCAWRGDIVVPWGILQTGTFT
ncbi:unnamed protein product [Alternaria alternata]